MKKILAFLFLCMLGFGAYIGWNLYGPSVSSPEGKYFYIKTGASYDEVKLALLDKKLLKPHFGSIKFPKG